jgi:hypothetical protein
VRDPLTFVNGKSYCKFVTIRPSPDFRSAATQV